MQRFWADGFAGTSVRDLGDAMGLGQASVYNAFGDKRTLFTQCLDRYLDANMRARIVRVEMTLPPRQAIETFLTEIVERSLESRLGCLLANAALEVAPHDRDIAAVVAERMGELEAFFRHSLWRRSVSSTCSTAASQKASIWRAALKERILHDVGYGLSLEGASAADLVKIMQSKK